MKKAYLLILSFLFFACIEERDCNETPNISGIDQQQLASDIQEIESYLESNNISYETDASGIRIATLENGTGDSPDNCSIVIVDYEGRVLGSGSKFDTGIGTQFTLSSNNLITGWKFGLYNMRNNGEYRLYIPSGLAYGEDTVKNSADSIIIPPHSNLEFRIRLTGVGSN